jgi:hypothetical protein
VNRRSPTGASSSSVTSAPAVRARSCSAPPVRNQVQTIGEWGWAARLFTSSGSASLHARPGLCIPVRCRLDPKPREHARRDDSCGEARSWVRNRSGGLAHREERYPAERCFLASDEEPARGPGGNASLAEIGRDEDALRPGGPISQAFARTAGPHAGRFPSMHRGKRTRHHGPACQIISVFAKEAKSLASDSRHVGPRLGRNPSPGTSPDARGHGRRHAP